MNRSDPIAARELLLYIENDGDLYRRSTEPYLALLSRKWEQGIYDHKLAVQGFMPVVEAGARQYTIEHGSPGTSWHQMFPRVDRLLVAEAMANYFEDEAKEGHRFESSRRKRNSYRRADHGQAGRQDGREAVRDADRASEDDLPRDWDAAYEELDARAQSVLADREPTDGRQAAQDVDMDTGVDEAVEEYEAGVRAGIHDAIVEVLTREGLRQPTIREWAMQTGERAQKLPRYKIWSRKRKTRSGPLPPYSTYVVIAGRRMPVDTPEQMRSAEDALRMARRKETAIYNVDGRRSGLKLRI